LFDFIKLLVILVLSRLKRIWGLAGLLDLKRLLFWCLLEVVI